MVRILVTPERLHELSRQMSQAAAQLRDLDGQLGRVLGGLDWEVRQQIAMEGQVQSARQQVRQLADQADVLARYLIERAVTFQQTDSQSSAEWDATFRRFGSPVSGPTPTLTKDIHLSLKDAIHSLDDLLKPIDWISNSRKASQVFNNILENIGRMLNSLTSQRGHIKMMGQLGIFLQDASKGTSFLSNILDLRDMNSYFSGQMSNAEIADVAIKILVPIPIFNDRIAQWAVQNMADPNGHWHGLVSTVESR